MRKPLTTSQCVVLALFWAALHSYCQSVKKGTKQVVISTQKRNKNSFLMFFFQFP